MSNELNTSRRKFLGYTAATGVAGGLATLPTTRASDTDAIPEVRNYHRLGRTGLEISDVSMGTSSLRLGQESLVDYALDRGINYFDSAHSYARGQSEQTIGNALKGKRDSVYIVSKAVTEPTASVDWLMNHLNTSLKRLQTDYVDVYMCHAVNDLARIKSPDWLEFLTRAKEQGKIRFSGMSGHAGNLAECLDYGLEQDWTDVVLVAYNFGEDPAFYEKFLRNQDWVQTQPEIPRLLKKAKANDVGVTVMKTLRGARLNDLRDYETEGGTMAQAALRWVLSNADVDAAVITMKEQEQVDEFLGASGADRLTSADTDLLERYYALNSATYCRPNCGECLSSCPYGVEINEVLRTRMYAVDYHDLQFAREEYGMIATNGQACLSCSGEPCQSACNYGVQIDKVCGPTHSLLT